MEAADEEAMPITCPGLSTMIYGLLRTDEEFCLPWTGVEVMGVRGSGEWLGVEMGDPAGEKAHRVLDE